MLKLNQPQLFRQQAYINGQWCQAANGKTLAVYNPATAEILGNVPAMGKQETAAAIKAAEQALLGWRKKSGKERAALLQRWYQLIEANRQDLSVLLTAEQGKPLSSADNELSYGANFVEWFAEEAKRVYGDFIPAANATQRILVIKQPIGVVGAITPWNFPSAMITRKCAPALAAGCTVVLKPSELTPFSALALAELAEQAGIPAGVINIVTGPPEEIGDELTANPLVRKITFTGSTRVGKLLMTQSAASVKKVSLELGGNAPFIVFDDADIEAALDGLMASKFRNSGQACVCANRIFIHTTIYEEFTEKLLNAVRQLHVADGLADKSAQIGPLINEMAVNKVERLIADAEKNGAKILLGGKPHALGKTFFEPTVLTEVNAGMQIAQEEIFGPVAALIRFESEAEVIASANATEYGLASYCYSRDIDRIFRVAEQLEYGMVGINCGLLSNEMSPFGGVKESGIGREGSKYGIEEFLEIKAVTLNLQ